MQLLLLNQFFHPDTAATSQLLSDLVRDFAADNELTVVCGAARYAAKGASSQPACYNSTLINSHAADSSPGSNFRVLRTRTFAFGRKPLARLASYTSYLAGTLWYSLRTPHPDLCLTLTTPPLLPALGALVAALRRTRFIIWEMDLYPDIATDLGYFRGNGLVDRLVGSLLDWSRRRADMILALGDEMRRRLIARGIPAEKIHVAENWADGHEIRWLPLPEGPLTLHYSGNLGLAHETETVTAVIDRLRNHPRYRFIFAGGGPRRPALESFCRAEAISNVEFRPYCARADLGRSLAEGHIGLVTQRPETLGSVVPSKIYGIMAAGRPILYIGPEDGTPAHHIRNFRCGWHLQPGDADGLIDLLHLLLNNRHLVHDAGARARAAFERHFDRPIALAHLRKLILDDDRAHEPECDIAIAAIARSESDTWA